MQKRGKYFQKDIQQNVSQPTKSQSDDVNKAKAQNSLTRMLLLVTFSFLILNSPIYIFYFVYLVVSPFSSAEAFAEYILVAYISTTMFRLIFAINFYLYCLGGSKFRQDMRRVFEKLCNK